MIQRVRDTSTSQGTPKMPANPQKLGMGTEQSVCEDHRGTLPSPHLSLGLLASRFRDETFLLCEFPSLQELVTATPGSNYTYTCSQITSLLKNYGKYKNHK